MLACLHRRVGYVRAPCTPPGRSRAGVAHPWGRAVRVGGAVRLFLAHLEFPLDLLGNLPKCHYRSSRRLYPLASAWGVDLATISTEAT